MTKREVKQVLASYRDVDGVWRHALAGASVDVDPKDLDRFDKVNGAPPQREGKPAAKKAAPRRK